MNILVYGLFAVGFNMLYGYLGLLSFGHAALFGGGAYACGIALVAFRPALVGRHLGRHRSPAPWSPRSSARSPSAPAASTSPWSRWPSSQCLYYVAYQATAWTGGENGLRGVTFTTHRLPGLRLDVVDPLTRYYVVAAFVVAALYVLSRILASPFGAVMEALRENESRARACGYDVRATRFLAFTLSGGVLRPGRRAAGAASRHRPDRDAALRHLRASC